MPYFSRLSQSPLPCTMIQGGGDIPSAFEVPLDPPILSTAQGLELGCWVVLPSGHLWGLSCPLPVSPSAQVHLIEEKAPVPKVHTENAPARDLNFPQHPTAPQRSCCRKFSDI